MTKLFQDLVTSRTNQGSAREFINEASRKGFTMSIQDFFRFAEMAKGRDMGDVVRELRESGDINENQYRELEKKAKGFLNLIKIASGE